MNSRDDTPRAHDDGRDPFVQRIADAARSLRKRAPDGVLERARAGARDLDAAIDTAARALPERAPLALLDLRIAAAARDLKRTAPEGTFDAIRAQVRRSRFIVLRNAIAIAASLLVAAFFLSRLAPDAQATSNPALLTSTALAQSLFTTAQLDREADKLARRVSGDPELAADEATQPLLEEIAFLDQAIEECKQALEVSQAHAHLRERLVELAAQRVELLRQVAEHGSARR